MGNINITEVVRLKKKVEKKMRDPCFPGENPQGNSNSAVVTFPCYYSALRKMTTERGLKQSGRRMMGVFLIIKTGDKTAEEASGPARGEELRLIYLF